MTMQYTPGAFGIDTRNDRYDDWRHAIALRFESIPASTPLFHTDAVNLNDTYLDPFSGAVRQHYTCTTCRHFLERYGDLVTIDPETGVVTPALWRVDDAPPAFFESARRLHTLVAKARVVGVFLVKESVLGESPKGGFTHFSVSNSAHAFSHPLKSASQEAADFRERFRLVREAVSVYTPTLLADALQLLQASEQGRTEVAIGPIRWLLALAEKVRAVNDYRRRDAVVWRAVAVAPAGFCHPNSSVAGTVLQDLLDGVTPAEAAKKFAAKTAPLAYNRPQAAPSEGAIREAEKAFEKLGLAPALPRRAAGVDELLADAGLSVIWRPRPQHDPASSTHGRIFDHVRAAQAPAALPKHDLAEATMTWARFAEEVLPQARSIEVMADPVSHFCTFTTAVDPEAPPILGWDHAERRNRYSWFYMVHGSAPSDWGLSPGWLPVRGVVPRPCHWHGNAWPKHDPDAHFVVEATKLKVGSNGVIFPEHLPAHLKPFDRVIEAHSRVATLHMPPAPGIALALTAGDGRKCKVRVDTGASARRVIVIDRWK